MQRNNLRILHVLRGRKLLRLLFQNGLLQIGAYASLFLLLAATNPQVGSPSATRTIQGDILPAEELPFGRGINLNAASSTPWWSPRIVPPKGAPNI